MIQHFSSHLALCPLNETSQNKCFLLFSATCTRPSNLINSHAHIQQQLSYTLYNKEVTYISQIKFLSLSKFWTWIFAKLIFSAIINCNFYENSYRICCISQIIFNLWKLFLNFQLLIFHTFLVFCTSSLSVKITLFLHISTVMSCKIHITSNTFQEQSSISICLYVLYKFQNLFCYFLTKHFTPHVQYAKIALFLPQSVAISWKILTTITFILSKYFTLQVYLPKWIVISWNSLIMSMALKEESLISICLSFLNFKSKLS